MIDFMDRCQPQPATASQLWISLFDSIADLPQQCIMLTGLDCAATARSWAAARGFRCWVIGTHLYVYRDEDVLFSVGVP